MSSRRGASDRRGGRDLAVRVRSAKKRSASSAEWLRRQLNDPYVAAAKRAGYRSRAAFKLAELDDRFHLLKPGQRIIDLGAAPGGWTQVVLERARGGAVIALDINPMDPLPGARVMCLDFLDADAPDRLKEALGGPAEVVLSDMSPPTTGHGQTDHLRIVGLVEAALEFALDVLAPGGIFVAKVFQGGTEGGLLARMKKHFAVVKHAKPPASRKDSAEVYVVATGFRG